MEAEATCLLADSQAAAHEAGFCRSLNIVPGALKPADVTLGQTAVDVMFLRFVISMFRFHELEPELRLVVGHLVAITFKCVHIFRVQPIPEDPS